MSKATLIEHRIRWVGLILAILVLFRFLSRNVGWTIDDAFITYRYSEHVIDGLGPVYNAGERVEGYTCFSWMALLAVGGQLGVPVPLFAKVTGMLFVFGSVTLLAFWDGADPTYTKKEAVLCALGVATTASFAQWGVSGMETAMFCFLGIAVVHAYLKLYRDASVQSALVVGMLGCALTMTRPNGVVLLLVLLGHALIHRRTLGTRTIVVFVLVFAVAYGSYFLWRWSYYGYFLPNTFYAKVGSSGAQLNRGVRYAISAMPAYALLLVPVVAAWGRASQEDTPEKRGSSVLLALVVAHITYVIAVGGDNFPAHRFLVVIVPFLWLLAVKALRIIAPSDGRRALLAAVIIGYNFVAGAFDPETRVRIAKDYVAPDGALVGWWLNRNTEPDAVIATNSAGALAYYSERTIVDMLGLNDAEIAHTPMPTMGRGKAGHEKGNGFYVLSRQPDYVFFGPPKGSGRPMFAGGVELFELQGFKDRYVYEQVEIRKGLSLQFYRRLSDEELEERRIKREKKLAEAEKKKREQEDKRKAKKKSKKGRKGKKRPKSTDAPAGTQP